LFVDVAKADVHHIARLDPATVRTMAGLALEALKAREAKTLASSDWIEWSGGENPAPRKIVRVLFRDGDSALRDSSLFDWDNLKKPSDIVMYRIVGDA
jgi:hypothetical protein